MIISWARLGQAGHSHINNHANSYVISLFEVSHVDRVVCCALSDAQPPKRPCHSLTALTRIDLMSLMIHSLRAYLQELGYRHVPNVTHALRYGRRYEIRGWHRFMMLRSTVLAFERLVPVQVRHCKSV